MVVRRMLEVRRAHLQRARARERGFTEHLASYLLAQRAANRSPRTIEFNRQRIERLARETHSCAPASITAPMVRAALLSVKSTDVSDRYVEQHRRCWAAFFRWICDEGELDRSPMANVDPWTVDSHEVAALDLAELARLYRATAGGSFLAERGRAIVALLFDTGIRPGELVAIELDDLHRDGTITVHGKSRRDRRVPISPHCACDLAAYIEHWRPPTLFAEPRSLFVDRTRARHPMSERALSQYLDALARAAGIRHVSPYMARHTFATLFLLGGGDPLELRRILGHKDLRMIDEHYLHLVTADLKRAHAIASPLTQMGELPDAGAVR